MIVPATNLLGVAPQETAPRCRAAAVSVGYLVVIEGNLSGTPLMLSQKPMCQRGLSREGIAPVALVAAGASRFVRKKGPRSRV